MIRFSIIIVSAAFLFCCSDVPENRSKGVVSSAAPEASAIGAEILEQGGNAVDAAIAVSFALGVSEPAMSGLGGGTQVLLSIPGRDVFMINGSTISPAATPIMAPKEDLVYHRKSTIPSTVKVLQYLYDHYSSGNLKWEELINPSIILARKGFVVGPFRAKVFHRYRDQLENSPHHTAPWLIDGEVPEEGDTLRQPLLAATLELLASGGAEVFYSGEIAREIHRDMIENGGWISFEDLSEFESPNEEDALHISYQCYDIYTSVPPCGGWTMLQILRLLEALPADYAKDERLIKALYLAHKDRQERPVQDISEYQPEVNTKLSDSYITLLVNDSKKNESPIEIEQGGETTHFSIVDGNGVAISVTASINAYFGARAASPTLGFLYNTYMDDFIVGDSLHSFSIGPGKPAYSSMSPTIVKREGETVLVLGSPGSSRIISSVAQVIDGWISSQDIVNQVAKPRIHVNRDRVYFEANPTVTVEWLMANELTRAEPNDQLGMGGLNAYFGGIHAIALENDQWVGVADPRRDGSAIVIKE